MSENATSNAQGSMGDMQDDDEISLLDLLQVVVDNLNIDATFIYVVQKSHREQYNLDTLLNLITPNCKIVEVDGITEGAACTTLLAKEYIDNDQPLVMANSDQFVEWDSNEFMYKMQETNSDGGIVTFTATHPKWSFAKIDEKGLVIEVAEKKVISDKACAGIYYFRHGNEYIESVVMMIAKNIRTNNEFYIAPAYNELIAGLGNVSVYEVDVNKKHMLGTPYELEIFLDKVENGDVVL